MNGNAEKGVQGLTMLWQTCMATERYLAGQGETTSELARYGCLATVQLLMRGAGPCRNMLAAMRVKDHATTCVHTL